ncbi:MAG TPA: hypothetical protein VND64_34300 [Pirellulales bacterium]|nr:hypothetical protein [Pirellulales bacterium]
MSKQHGARQQKRLAKQKAKRDQKRRQLARVTSDNPMISLGEADSWPILATLVPEGLWNNGLGQLVIARRAPAGKIACGVFLVDVFCLGVKNAFWRVTGSAEYETLIDKIEAHGRLREVTPEYFSKLVHCAADYAQSLGFAPHRDFRAARLMLVGIDPSLCPDELEFGKDGKPLYIRGPNESLEKARLIASQINALGGHYLVRVDGPAPAMIGLDDEGEEDDGETSDERENDRDVDESPAAQPWRWFPPQ